MLLVDDERDEAASVVFHIQQLHAQGLPFREIAVLYRVIRSVLTRNGSHSFA